MPPGDRFYARTFALVTTLGLGIAFYRIIEPFLGPLVWAVFIAFLLNPLHRRLTVALRNRPQTSAFALTMLTLVVFAEKVLPGGQRTSRVVGVAFLILGVVVAGGVLRFPWMA